MQEKAAYTYQKMNQDGSKAKHSDTFYWDAHNVRVVTNEEFGSVTNSQGNEIVLGLPITTVNPTDKLLGGSVAFPVVGLRILHTEKIDEKVVLFTTNENVDCIFVIEETSLNFYTATLVYIDHLGFTFESQIESVGIKENEEAEKVYWVDGENEIRMINILDAELLNKEVSEISLKPSATQTNPEVVGFSSGGSHQAGTVQYAYNLYYKYGAQTKISPLSRIVALGNDEKGAILDANVSKSPIVFIDGIDTKFDYIKIYSIFYSSLDITPKISLIYENTNANSSLQITDTNEIINEVALDEFNIIATQNIQPKHIETKDGHLFYANYKTNKFDVDYDARAFAMLNALGIGWTATIEHASATYQDYMVWDHNLEGMGVTRPAGTISFAEFLTTVEDDHDCINNDNTAVTKHGGSEVGGSGTNINYWLRYKEKAIDSTYDSAADTSLKRGERYRLGIVFTNNQGEESFVKWIADVRIPDAQQGSIYQTILEDGNAQLAYIEVEVKNMPAEAASYNLVIVERKDNDMTVKGQGIANPSIYMEAARTSSSQEQKLERVFPAPCQRTYRESPTIPVLPILTKPSGSSEENTYRGDKFQKHHAVNFGDNSLDVASTASDIHNNGVPTDASFVNSKPHWNLMSPDMTFGTNRLGIDDTYNIRTVGYQKNTKSFSKADFYTAIDTQNSKDKPIDVRKSWEFDTDDARIYLYQCDDLPEADSDAHADKFFKIESTDANGLASNDSVKLLTGKRPNFERSEDMVIVNRYEFKKVFYKRKFGQEILTLPGANGNVTTIDDASSIIYAPAIDADIAISSQYEKQGDGFFSEIDIVTSPTPQWTNSPTSDDPLTAEYHAGSQLVFTSLDLHDHAKNIFENGTMPSVAGEDYALILEFYNDNISQYGGKTFADRQRNVYVPYSQSILATTLFVDGEYGDTYIQSAPLLRSFEDTSAAETIECTLSEIVDFVCESSVNNSMRYDTLESISKGDGLDEDAYGHNSVYEQKSVLTKSISEPFNFTTQDVFRSEIAASPIKFLGELVDSWSSISVNDRITLDTSYGEITGMTKLRDVIFTFQKNAISYLSVNPRVQIAANDSVPIVLGTGSLLERYEYISTNSGTMHNKSITSVEAGIFYFDILNRSINRISKSDEEVTLTKGLYNFTKEYTRLNHGNLLKNIEGVATTDFSNVISHYDNKNEDILFTLKTDDDSFTVAYNLISDGFSSFYDFTPFTYFNINNKMFTAKLGEFNDEIWEHDKGLYNSFYSTYYPSKIKLLMNANPQADKIINNINFITDTKLAVDDTDQPLITINKVKMDTAYQTSGEVNLVMGAGIRRKFREFNVIVPREEGTRNRIRAPWSFAELTFDHAEDDYKFVLYDTTFLYTIN